MIYPVTMYAGKCDNCGCDIKLGGGDFAAYGEPEHVLFEMEESDWMIVISESDQKHYCLDCFYWDDEDNFCLNKIDKDEPTP